jgi:hypothetical protein
MKQYPSIPGVGAQPALEFDAWIFDKLDGSNLRFEWDRKLGWHRFGTRTQPLQRTHPWLGSAIPIFLEQWATPLEDAARQRRWQSLTAFCEFWGQQSFAGRHVAGDQMRLSLIDVNVYKRGLIAPEEFLELFGTLEIAPFLGVHKVSPALIEAVKHREFPGISFEGVVAKVGGGHGRTMVKIKTQSWMDRVRERFGADEAAQILES